MLIFSCCVRMSSSRTGWPWVQIWLIWLLLEQRFKWGLVPENKPWVWRITWLISCIFSSKEERRNERKREREKGKKERNSLCTCLNKNRHFSVYSCCQFFSEKGDFLNKDIKDTLWEQFILKVLRVSYCSNLFWGVGGPFTWFGLPNTTPWEKDATANFLFEKWQQEKKTRKGKNEI